MAACADVLEAEGLRICGLLQRFGAPIAPGKREMLLTVLPGRETIRLNDRRGPGVIGCTLDADALTRAAMALRDAIRARPDLLIVARFGKEEAAGGGLRAELADALLDRVPLIIGVRRAVLPAWEDFLGAPAQLLPPNPRDVVEW